MQRTINPEILKPHFLKSGIQPIGTVVIGTVKGDLHDIGKNIVSMMLKGACFNVHDLGIDVPVEKFVDAAKRENAQLKQLYAETSLENQALKELIHRKL